MGKLPAIQLQRVQYAEKLVKDGKIVNIDDFIMGIETDNITSLTDEQLNLLKAGDIVIKHTGEQDHAYRVSYKEDGQGICLTYVDASCVETVSYDFVDNSWVYNSTDISIIEDRQAKLTTTSVNDGTLDKAVGFDSQGNLVKGSAGGGGIDIVEISTSSGTLSDAEFSKLGPDCIIKYNHNNIHEYLTLDKEDNIYFHYSSFDYAETNTTTDKIIFYEVLIRKNDKTFSTLHDESNFLKASSTSISVTNSLSYLIGEGSTYEIFKEHVSHFRIPSGGTTGQVLAKSSGTDYDIGWVNAGGGGSGHTFSFICNGTGDNLTLYFANGTTESVTYPSTGIRNNVVACHVGMIMPQLNSGVVFGYDSTSSKIKICTPTNTDIGYFVGEDVILLSNAEIEGLGMG